MLVKTFILSALFSIVTSGLCLHADSTSKQKHTAKPNGSSIFALVIQHIGAQDRPVPTLLLYAASARKRVEKLYDCKGMECLAVSDREFDECAKHLRTEFFANHTNDAAVSQAGSYSFTLVDEKQMELRCNPLHSAKILARAIDLLKNSPAKQPLTHRLHITGI